MLTVLHTLLVVPDGSQSNFLLTRKGEIGQSIAVAFTEGGATKNDTILSAPPRQTAVSVALRFKSHKSVLKIHKDVCRIVSKYFIAVTLTSTLWFSPFSKESFRVLISQSKKDKDCQVLHFVEVTSSVSGWQLI